MKYWEFLIQKEGDQTWLPLETQQVEILEGRYRVVAHTDRANTPVEIRVSQIITDEMPPRQRVRKRTGATNESGLAVVMPFVHLKPGQWKLKCSSVAGVDNRLGDDWQYDVQLQVFAQSEDDWSGEWPVPQDSQSATSVLADEAGSGEPLVNADLPLIQAQAELQQRVEQSADGEAAQARFEGSNDRAYQVALRQQAYLSQRDQPLTIMGKVSALTDAPGEAASQLWIRLQNPETAGVIMEAHRPLSLARLPADFKVQIQLPNDVKTRVVLGEVSLRTAVIEGERPAQVLASTAFTITTGIDRILDAIANQDPGTFEEEIPLLSDANGADLASTREPLVPSFDLSQRTSVPAERTVLPPQLEQRQESEPLGESLKELPTQIGSSLIDLPTFNQTTFDQTAFEPIPPSQLNQRADGQLDPLPDRELAEPLNSLGPDAELLTTSGVDSSVFNTPAIEVEPGAVNSPHPRPPVPMPSMVSAPAQFVGTSIEDSDLEADEIAAALDDIDQDLLDEPSDLDALEAPGIEGVVGSIPRISRMIDAEAERVSDGTALPAAEEASKSSDQPSQRRPVRKSGREVEANLAFQSLKLKDHFWQRLSSLNRQSHEEATKLAENMAAAGVQRSWGDGLLASSAAEDYAGDEVVIYDEPPVSDKSSSNVDTDMELGAKSQAASTVDDSISDSASRYRDRLAKARSRRERSALPASQPTSTEEINESGPATQKRLSSSEEDLPEMALPVISLPMGDLVAGQTVTVTVRSRPSTYKPFIKLWMVDRQSRSLMIDPKILTNLTRDALGDLQGTTELQVPMDCLDVQIAAIAIDMATQQESGKAIVNRRVIPANQTSTRGRFNL
ncbi:MAG: hypothetical protein DCF25_08175 [Leptolyngbya foveolarum]|uniref:Uncharacterized protein n=1 Tax=Leptolyngbya foveolarum TaxID=47253 RepID=A0A2W4URJ6_9CYAN|nr:MAG: hypothetical protein DCF25_08175 [Leptolyngbya foveolarum]